MKKVELCVHNLKTEEVLDAALELEAKLENRAEVVRVSCIGDCKACHAGALIARIDGQIITDADSALVIAKVIKLVS